MIATRTSGLRRRRGRVPVTRSRRLPRASPIRPPGPPGSILNSVLFSECEPNSETNEENENEHCNEAPADQRDERDTDGDGETEESNGQTDIVEERLFYTKDTPGNQLDLHVVEPTPTLGGELPPMWVRIHAGDPDMTDEKDILAFIEFGSFDEETINAETEEDFGPFVCIYETGEDVSTRVAIGSGDTRAEACEDQTTVWKDINVAGQLAGEALHDEFGAEDTDPKPLFTFTDEDENSQPESVTINLFDLESCEPSGTIEGPVPSGIACGYQTQNVPLDGTVPDE